MHTYTKMPVFLRSERCHHVLRTKYLVQHHVYSLYVVMMKRCAVDEHVRVMLYSYIVFPDNLYISGQNGTRYKHMMRSRSIHMWRLIAACSVGGSTKVERDDTLSVLVADTEIFRATN